MIYLFSGTPGSGKSLHTASKIYYALRIGRPVIANFEINLKRVHKRKWDKLPFTYVANGDLTPDFLVQFSRDYWHGRPVKEDRILLVFDECQLLFNAREWQKFGREKWLKFFTHHRKYGYQIILIAQFDRMIDRQIRSVIEYEYKHRKLSNFGIAGKIMSAFALGKAFCAVKMWYPLNERLGAEWFTARKKFYSIYDTFADFDAMDKKELPAAGTQKVG